RPGNQGTKKHICTLKACGRRKAPNSLYGTKHNTLSPARAPTAPKEPWQVSPGQRPGNQGTKKHICTLKACGRRKASDRLTTERSTTPRGQPTRPPLRR